MSGFPSPTPHTPSPLPLTTSWATLPVSLDNGIARHMRLRQQHFCLPHNVIAQDVSANPSSRRTKSSLCNSRKTPSRIRSKESRSDHSFRPLLLHATAPSVSNNAPPRLSETPSLAQSLPTKSFPLIKSFASTGKILCHHRGHHRALRRYVDSSPETP